MRLLGITVSSLEEISRPPPQGTSKPPAAVTAKRQNPAKRVSSTPTAAPPQRETKKGWRGNSGDYGKCRMDKETPYRMVNANPTVNLVRALARHNEE